MGIISYALFSWRKPPEVPAGATPFHHERSGSLVAGIAIVVFVEALVIHLWLLRRAPIVAWGLLALSLYGVLWLIGDFRAIVARPPLVTDDSFILRVGLRYEAVVPLALIERTDLPTWRSAASAGPTHLDLARPEDPNVIVYFREPITVRGFYGIRKTITSLALRLEDPRGFVDVVRSSG